MAKPGYNVGGFFFQYPFDDSVFDGNIFYRSSGFSVGISGASLMLSNNSFFGATPTNGQFGESPIVSWTTADAPENFSLEGNNFFLLPGQVTSFYNGEILGGYQETRNIFEVVRNINTTGMVLSNNYVQGAKPNDIEDYILDSGDDLNRDFDILSNNFVYQPNPNAPVTPENPPNIEVFGTPLSDIIIGGMGADSINGLEGDDTIIATKGNDQIDGGDGTDRVSYDGDQDAYTVTLGPSGVQVRDRRPDGNGTDTLTNIEFLEYTGDFANFNLDQFGGATSLNEADFKGFIELYIAYFNRAPDAIGLNFWGTAYANGTTMEQMAELFAPQDETLATYPEGTSNTEFAIAVYNNVLGRIPDQAGFDFWVDVLDGEWVTRDQFILEVLRGVQDGSPDRGYLDNKVDVGAYFAVHKGMSDTANASAAMQLYDGTGASIQTVKQVIDAYHLDALDPITGEFLMPLVGVLDNPFV